MSAPRVSVIVLNLNGREHLSPCFESLLAGDGSSASREILLVDNGSSDGSVEFVRDTFPSVRIVELSHNHGYAAAMNLGCREAAGEILVFINNDTRADDDAVSRLVAPIEAGTTVATAAKILSFDGRELHFAGGGTNFHGIAFQHAMGEQDGDAYSKGGPTLFGCGAAMAIRRDVFFEVGAFDEGFFAYYEDVDLGWRLWVLGYDVQFVPEARVYHHHSATSLKIPIHRVRVLHIRNPLQMIYKNYGDEALGRILSVALLLTMRRTWYLAGVEDRDFRIGDVVAPASAKRSVFSRRERSRGEYEESMTIRKLGVSDLVALNDIVAGAAGLREKREQIQSRRRRPDEEILPLFLDPFRCAEGAPEYAEFQDELCASFGIRDLFAPAATPPRVE